MNLVKLENLSACDFRCDGNKVYAKKHVDIVDSTGGDIPFSYSTIQGTPPANLREGALLLEVFDNAIAFWVQKDCDHTDYDFELLAVKTDISFADLDAKQDKIVDILNTSSVSYNLTTTDANKYIRFTAATPVNLNVPDNATEPFIIGTVITIFEEGGGTVTIVPSPGVVVNSNNNNLTLLQQYTGAQLIKVGVDEWDLIGAL